MKKKWKSKLRRRRRAVLKGLSWEVNNYKEGNPVHIIICWKFLSPNKTKSKFKEKFTQSNNPWEKLPLRISKKLRMKITEKHRAWVAEVNPIPPTKA